jgi:hypothetical protein
MLGTTIHISRVWVPPPPPPPGFFKLVKTIVTTDLNTGHRHAQHVEDWKPEGASAEELAAVAKIEAMQPPRAFTTTVVSPIHETPEEYHARTAPAAAPPSSEPDDPPKKAEAGVPQPRHASIASSDPDDAWDESV